VAWITERRDVLMGLFAFATVLAWLEACRSGAPGRPARRWYWTAVGCFAAALLSKVMVVGLPIVLVVLDVYPLRRLRADEGRWPTPLLRLWEIRQAASEVPEAARVARGRLAFNLGALLEQYRQPGQALEQYRAAAILLPDDVTAGGRARRLAAMVASSKPVACGRGGRP
jgi:hypothetical protein